MERAIKHHTTIQSAPARMALASLLLAWVAGCEEEVAPPLISGSASPLIAGREFLTTAWDGDEFVPLHIGPGHALWENTNTGIVDRLRAGCTSEQGRFTCTGCFLPTEDETDDICGGYAARDQGVALCMGYRFLTLSEAVSAYEITDEGVFRRAPPEGGHSEDVDYVVPPPGASDAASLALIAVSYFQEAALRGAAILDPGICDDEALDATVPAGKREGSGHTGSTGERVTLGAVMASATVEALHLLDDASKRATQMITSAAAERMATERDSQLANRLRWRGGSDSRLEIVEMMHGIPTRLAEPEVGVDAGVPEPPNGDYPVLDTRAETAEEGVDPILSIS